MIMEKKENDWKRKMVPHL